MKIRDGFVSNSSSSSFIIAVKGENLKQKMQQYSKELQTKLGKKFPFADFIEEIFNYMTVNSSIFHVNDNLYDDYTEDNYWEEHPRMKKLVDKGYMLYETEASSDDESPVALYLYDRAYKIEFENADKTLIAIQKE